MRGALLCFVLAGCAHARPTSWLGRSIYFVVTDRFSNGDASNDDADGYASDLADPDAWHGGDLQGVIDRLGYIQRMGFTGLWLTPVVQQHDRHAYHGYWGWDFSRIDGHLGDLGKLKQLVDEAHRRGIAVLLDTVANHTGRYHHAAASFPDAAMYHHHGSITDWNDPVQLETFDVNGLDDLDQDVPAVRKKLLDHVRWLVTSTGIDGLRIDTAKHVPRTFLRDDAAASGVFTLGEILDGDVAHVAPYSHVLDATLDYPLYYAIRDVLVQHASARRLGAVFAQDGAYRDARLSGTFVDNHDQARFLCKADVPTLELALALVFTARGLPILYYGTEQALRDCQRNREDLRTFDDAAPLYAYVAKLNHARNAALRIGSQLERWQDDTAYAFERESGPSFALVTFNFGDGARAITLSHMRAPSGTVLHDALGQSVGVTVGGDHTVTVHVPARSVLVLTN